MTIACCLSPEVVAISIVIALLLGLPAAWLLIELAMRFYLCRPLPRDFYGGISRQSVREKQDEIGLRVASGAGWVHLGWIADPERERYRIERRSEGANSSDSGEPAAMGDENWNRIGCARFGSFLLREEAAGGCFRVWADPGSSGTPRLIGEVEAAATRNTPRVLVPQISGPWRTIFRPRIHGHYVNDHTVYQDADGDWRLVGITSPTQGDFDAERCFAVGVSSNFPPDGEMREQEAVADFGELAWAPHVIRHDARWHMFWSPHSLHQMHSTDGIHWRGHEVTLKAPFHRFFRDPMVLEVAPSQWLLYTTARGRYYSRVDVYQSFDLHDWQYIRGALETGPGSERNSPFASTESPNVVCVEERYYLAVTYNNDSFFWPGMLMLLRVWRNRASYDETLVFHSSCPYDFGRYDGRSRAPTLVARLEAHAPEFIEHPETGEWAITTCGWPWVANITSGEVAVAALSWRESQREE